MGISLSSIIGGSIGDAFQKIVSCFKVTPDKALEAQTELSKIQADLQAKVQDAVDEELKSSAAIITAEANSQSWLPRNVRPLLLLLWGLIVTAKPLATIIAAFVSNNAFYVLQGMTIDPWVYKLTAIGFTGYVTARTWEKVTDSDK